MKNETWTATGTGSERKYDLRIEFDRDWFAVVFMDGGRWTYRIGTRLRDGEKQKLYSAKRGWKMAATAKSRALRSIRHFKANTFGD